MKKEKLDLYPNIFTDEDHEIVRSAIERLPGLLPEIVKMRFWKHQSLDEISLDLGVSLQAATGAFNKAMSVLRIECMKQPRFSRSWIRMIYGSKSAITAA